MIIRPPKTPPPRRPPRVDAEAASALAQDKADFTAEGSPPPGQVAGAAPRLPVDEDAPPAAAPPPKGAAAARRQPPTPAGPATRASKRSPAAWRSKR